MRSFIKFSLLAFILMFPLHSFGAETLKLRYLTSATTDDKEGQIKQAEKGLIWHLFNQLVIRRFVWGVYDGTKLVSTVHRNITIFP